VVIIFRFTINEKIRENSIEQFQIRAREISMQFDNDLLDSDDNYDYVADYTSGTGEYAYVVDSTSTLLYHPMQEFIGMKSPIPEINEKVEQSINQPSDSKEDLFFTYEFNGDEKMLFLHNGNNQVILLIIAPIDGYE